MTLVLASRSSVEWGVAWQTHAFVKATFTTCASAVEVRRQRMPRPIPPPVHPAPILSWQEAHKVAEEYAPSFRGRWPEAVESHTEQHPRSAEMRDLTTAFAE